MENTLAAGFISIIIGIIIWIYAIIRTINSEFHKPVWKKIWLFALIFLPPTALLFPFIGDKQTK
ncbi:MAG: hypothetical protein ABF301_04005 [Sulfurovum sp.]|jgi:hypothetical protein